MICIFRALEIFIIVFKPGLFILGWRLPTNDEAFNFYRGIHKNSNGEHSTGTNLGGYQLDNDLAEAVNFVYRVGYNPDGSTRYMYKLWLNNYLGTSYLDDNTLSGQQMWYGGVETNAVLCVSD